MTNTLHTAIILMEVSEPTMEQFWSLETTETSDEDVQNIFLRVYQHHLKLRWNIHCKFSMKTQLLLPSYTNQFYKKSNTSFHS